MESHHQVQACLGTSFAFEISLVWHCVSCIAMCHSQSLESCHA